jgi:glucose-1-phosphate adenylyltransferase
MSSKNKILGLIFSNIHDENIKALTEHRTMGSVLFGGRYRLIDFPLSAMANSGITEVGVITKSNYQSLLDHLGNGREWDLSRKNGGLHLLPPFSHTSSNLYRGRLEALYGVWEFVKRSDAEYILLSDCDIVANMDYQAIIDYHIKTGADITCAYAKSLICDKDNADATVFGVNEDGRIADVLVAPNLTGECTISLNTYVMKKDLLENIVMESKPRDITDFERGVLRAHFNDYKIMGYAYGGYFSRIASVAAYYAANMALLDSKNRNALFDAASPIYTKIRDNPPAKYGETAIVKNSLIGDGCIIEGTVENSVLFRGVKVGAGAIVKNSILMQDTSVGKKCEIDCVITDKNVNISDGRMLTGSKQYPVILEKFAQI